MSRRDRPELDAARRALDPSAGDAARVRAGLEARLGLSAPDGHVDGTDDGRPELAPPSAGTELAGGAPIAGWIVGGLLVAAVVAVGSWRLTEGGRAAGGDVLDAAGGPHAPAARPAGASGTPAPVAGPADATPTRGFARARGGGSENHKGFVGMGPTPAPQTGHVGEPSPPAEPPRPAVGRSTRRRKNDVFSATSSSSTAAGPPSAVAVDPVAEEAGRLRAAQRALGADRPSDALALLDEPRGPEQLRPERLALRAIALCALGRRAAGVAEARRLLGLDPSAPSRARVEAACGPIESPP